MERQYLFEAQTKNRETLAHGITDTKTFYLMWTATLGTLPNSIPMTRKQVFAIAPTIEHLAIHIPEQHLGPAKKRNSTVDAEGMPNTGQPPKQGDYPSVIAACNAGD